MTQIDWGPTKVSARSANLTAPLYVAGKAAESLKQSIFLG